jgi:hypothetical protein
MKLIIMLILEESFWAFSFVFAKREFGEERLPVIEPRHVWGALHVSVVDMYVLCVRRDMYLNKFAPGFFFHQTVTHQV